MAKYDDKIKELEDRIAKTKYNKKTQHAIGLYKAQIAQQGHLKVVRDMVIKFVRLVMEL
jgi:ribosome-interacting GTPase 1